MHYSSHGCFYLTHSVCIVFDFLLSSNATQIFDCGSGVTECLKLILGFPFANIDILRIFQWLRSYIN